MREENKQCCERSIVTGRLVTKTVTLQPGGHPQALSAQVVPDYQYAYL